MKLQKSIMLGALAGLLGTFGVVSQASAQSVAYLQKSNNDRVIAFQRAGCINKNNENIVSLSFYGGMAFKITSPCGMEIMIDPWRNDPSGIWGFWFATEFPVTQVDIGLVTHAHFDHDGVHRLDATMLLDRMSGTFELGDVKIIGIAEKHMCEPQGKYSYRSIITQVINEDPCFPNETTQWNNSLFVVETGGLRILHWGDNRQNPPQEVWDMIGDIDIALLAVSDEGHILSHEWGDVVMEKMNANIAIPSHYHVNGVNIPGWAGSEPAIKWVQSHEHTILDGPTVALTREMVDGYDNHVFYFGDHVAFPTGGGPVKDPVMPPVPEPVHAWRDLIQE